MKKTVIIIISIILTVSIVIGGISFLYPLLSSSASFVSEFNKTKELKSTDGRTNVLIVGVDTREEKYVQTGTLTDTMIIASVDTLNKNVRLLSVPRDLWVEVNEHGSKVNELLTVYGSDTLVTELEEALGIDIHYTAKVDFKSFEKAIDVVGGVTINNPVYFADNSYPKFGWENETCGIDVEELKKQKLKEMKEELKKEGIDEDEINKLTEEDVYFNQYDFPCRFEQVSFEKGEITLNGEQALKYARSRHSGYANQGSDFARAKRQHLIIFALVDKLTTVDTLSNPGKLKELFLQFSGAIDTDFTVSEFLLILPQISNIKDYSFDSGVISNQGTFEEGGVLVQGNSENYNGLYVLVPKEDSILKRYANYFFYRSVEDKE